MNCTRPVTISRPGYPDRVSHLIRGQEKPYTYDKMVVPCGKCMACVQKRQHDFAFRIRSEAEKRGTCVFVTLTYNNDNIPLVSTLWRASKLDGVCERLTAPEFVCYSRKEDLWDYRLDFEKIKPSALPRYIDFNTFEDEDYQYFTRLTPSVCRKDVQNWLKRCRVHFERKLGRTLDFSYSICSEYGSRFCRPHYHAVLMGISKDDADIFARLWKFGFTKVDFVNRVNSDGSDGFSRISNYVAKYVAKGDFTCDSEKCGAACKCRQMNSKSLGSSIVDKYASYVKCVDLIGADYNVDNFFCPDKKRYLSRPEIVRLVAEVPKRLAVSLAGKYYYSIPRIFRNKIFYVTKKSESSNNKYSRPSRLWKMVVDSLQSQYAELDNSEFSRLLSNKTPREIAESVASFNYSSEVFALAADDARKSNYKARLQSSVF